MDEICLDDGNTNGNQAFQTLELKNSAQGSLKIATNRGLKMIFHISSSEDAMAGGSNC